MQTRAQFGEWGSRPFAPRRTAPLDFARPQRPRVRRGAEGMSSPPNESLDPGLGYEADLELARRATARDPQALDELIRRWACVPAMLRGLQRRLGARLNAEELAEVDQNILGALWTKLADYEGRAALESWAFRFVQLELHKALDRRRRSSRLALVDGERLAELPVADPQSPAIDPATLRACVDRLGSPTSDIVSMRHYDDLSFDEIARRRCEALSAVKARYYRGLERLKTLLEPHMRRQS